MHLDRGKANSSADRIAVQFLSELSMRAFIDEMTLDNICAMV